MPITKLVVEKKPFTANDGHGNGMYDMKSKASLVSS